MSKIVSETDKAGLREFGFVTATIVALLFGLLLPFIFNHPIPKLPPAFQISMGLAAVALVIPILLKPVYVVWMYMGFALGWMNTRIILSVVFYTLFTPVALCLKLLRKDPMHRKISSDTVSYRRSSQTPPRHQMEKPY